MSGAQLNLWIFGFQISQALHVVARLGIADQLEDESLSTAVLAARCGCNADALARLLRALAGIGVFEQHGSGFRHSTTSRLLRRDHPQSQYLAAAVYGAEHYAAWGDLFDAVQQGEPVFERRFGVGYYRYLAQQAQRPGVYRDYQANDAQRRSAALQAVYGALPSDRVEVDSAELPRHASVYLLSHRLHRLADAPAGALLARCREAMHASSRLLVVEQMLPEQPDFDPAQWMDLNSLLLCGGRERSEAAYRELAAAAGLRWLATRPLSTGMQVLEFCLQPIAEKPGSLCEPSPVGASVAGDGPPSGPKPH